MRLLGKIGVILLALLLVSCGGDTPNPGANAPSSPTASPTAAPPEMSIGPIVWSETVDAESGAPNAEVSAFTPQSPAIIASIEANDIPEGTEFTAIWMLNDEPIEGGEMHVQADGDIDHAWIAFRFTREDDKSYPVGQLSVVITANTGVLREGSIEINFP